MATQMDAIFKSQGDLLYKTFGGIPYLSNLLSAPFYPFAVMGATVSGGIQAGAGKVIDAPAKVITGISNSVSKGISDIGSSTGTAINNVNPFKALDTSGISSSLSNLQTQISLDSLRTQISSLGSIQLPSSSSTPSISIGGSSSESSSMMPILLIAMIGVIAVTMVK